MLRYLQEHRGKWRYEQRFIAWRKNHSLRGHFRNREHLDA
jgi:hypothetical protein